MGGGSAHEDGHHHHGHGHGGDADHKHDHSNDFWDDYAEKYDDMSLGILLSDQYIEFCTDFLKRKVAYAFEEKLRILEFGCGPGRNIIGLKDAAKEALGMDLAPNMIKVFEKKIESQGLGSSYRGQVLTKPDASEVPKVGHDLVLVPFVIHHVEDPVTVLKNLISGVLPGGHLIIAEILNMDHFSEEDKKERNVHSWMTESDIDKHIAETKLPAVKKLEVKEVKVSDETGNAHVFFYALERVAV